MTRFSRHSSCILAAAVTVALLALPGAAMAGPLALDQPGNVSSLSQALIAYDPASGTTFVAWDVRPSSTGIDLCIFADDASSCSGGAATLLTDPMFSGDDVPTLSGLTVMPGGNVVVTGDAGNSGTVAWESPATGASFLASGHGLQAGGAPISQVNSFYQPDDVVPLSATDLGILDGENNLFGDIPYDKASSDPGVTADPEADFSSPPLDTGGAPQIAAEATPGGGGNETVVTTGESTNSSSQTDSGCPTVNNTGYGVRVGKVGSLESATPTESLLACSADAPVLTGGGTAGIGVVEEEGSGVAGTTDGQYTIDFRPFAATASGGSFGPAVQLANTTSHVLDGIDSLDATDDPGAGVYALWGDGQGEVLDYSANGGGAWGPPEVTPAPYGDGENMAAVGDGLTLIAYIANPTGSGYQVFLEPYDYQQPTTLSTEQSSGTTTGANISIAAGTVGEMDRVTVSGTNASIATGTADVGLYDNSSCSGTPTFSATADVVDGVATVADDTGPGLSSGTYYWKAAYSGDLANDPSQSTCGSEVLTVAPAATAGGTASATSSSVTVTVTCAVTPCTVTLTITIDPPRHITTLASGKFSVHKGRKNELKLKLTGAGKSLLKKDHGKLKATLTITTKTAHGTVKTSRTIKILQK